MAYYGRGATKPLPERSTPGFDLQPDETLHWSGTPKGGIMFHWSDALTVPVGVVFMATGYGMLTEPVTVMNGPEWLPWIFRLVFPLVGFYLAIGRFGLDAWKRSRTRYAVTDRRVLISVGGPFGGTTALRIDRLPTITFKRRADGRGTIIFGTQEIATKHHAADPKFNAIRDANNVRHLIERLASKRMD